MLEVSNIPVTYGQHRALTDVALNVHGGEIVVILGANGAGKSSLLKAIAGIVPSLPGKRVRLADHDLSGTSGIRDRERRLALVPEGRGIFGDLTVAENLLLGANPKTSTPRGGGAAQSGAVLVSASERAPWAGGADHEWGRTTDGRDRPRADVESRCSPASTSPHSALSPLLVRELFAALRQVRASGVGLLLVEQNAREGLAVADRGYLMENGKIVGSGTAAALMSDDAVRHAYLGGIVASAV